MTTKAKAHRHQALDPEQVCNHFYDASVRLDRLRDNNDPRLLPVKAALVDAIATVEQKLDYCQACGVYYAKR